MSNVSVKTETNHKMQHQISSRLQSNPNVLIQIQDTDIFKPTTLFFLLKHLV